MGSALCPACSALLCVWQRCCASLCSHDGAAADGLAVVRGSRGDVARAVRAVPGAVPTAVAAAADDHRRGNDDRARVVEAAVTPTGAEAAVVMEAATSVVKATAAVMTAAVTPLPMTDGEEAKGRGGKRRERGGRARTERVEG